MPEASLQGGTRGVPLKSPPRFMHSTRAKNLNLPHQSAPHKDKFKSTETAPSVA